MMGRGSQEPTADAERRRLTVMFCDLVGSSALSIRLDPEDFREIIRAYQDTCVAVVDRFRGYLSRYVGDGLLICFGYPESHEDDSERAIRAALEIVNAMPSLNLSLSRYQGVELAVRIGIASGLVVAGDIVGERATEQRAVVGQTPNLAARLQSAAGPNSVLISSDTRELLGEQFEYEELGPLKFNGFAEPMAAWRVIQPVEGVTRFAATRHRRLVPLIGRHDEINTLLECWRHAKEGFGQSVLLSGEAGIGKSRLAESFSEHIAGEPHAEWRYQCYSYHQSSAFHPIIKQLEQAAQCQLQDTAEEKLTKLERLLVKSNCKAQDVLPLLASLLSIPLTQAYAPLNLGPRQQKERTLAALADQFLGLARDQPVFVLVEDLHWMDPSSRELFDVIWERIGGARVLLLITTRDQHMPLAWSKAAHSSTIILRRLDREQSVAMVARMAGRNPLPRNVLEEIVQRTEGVPLHVEELTKSILGSNSLGGEGGRHCLSGPEAMRRLPDSLQASLMARLDQLGPSKRIAQFAATIGREFSFELLAEVSGLTSSGLKIGLERLLQSELIYQCGSVSQPSFIFKHALVQEAAHESLLLKERRDLHARTAEALQRHFPKMAESQPELLAHHYAQAGNVERALLLWMSAGRLSIERCAFLEATSQLRIALGSLANLSPSAERDEWELDVQMALGGAITAISGYAAEEAGAAFDRALALCRKLDRPDKLFPTLYGVGGFHLMRTELDKTQQIGNEILAHAETYGDATAKLLGFRLLGATLFLRGELLQARDHLHRVLELYDTEKHPSMIPLNSEDYLTTGLAYLSLVNTLLGNLDEALEASSKSLSHARQLGHVYSYAYALSFCEFMHQLRGESTAVRERTAELIDLSREQSYPLFLASARHLRGAALIDAGEIEEGLDLLQNGTSEYVALGISTYVPFGLGAVAKGLGRAGSGDASLVMINQAIALADKTGEQWSKAELIRQNGELLLMVNGLSAARRAETLFREAMTLAEAQGAALWELRAATSLARLWCDCGRHLEAHELLAPIHDRFTQGLDTPDVMDAKKLLSTCVLIPH
jgi:class 3 adenylate cyclase/predicted ATPase